MNNTKDDSHLDLSPERKSEPELGTNVDEFAAKRFERPLPIEDALDFAERVKRMLPNNEVKLLFHEKMSEILHLVYPNLFPTEFSSSRESLNLYFSIEDELDDDPSEKIAVESPYAIAKKIYDAMARIFGSKDLIMSPSTQSQGCGVYTITLIDVPGAPIEVQVFGQGIIRCVFYLDDIQCTYYMSYDAILKDKLLNNIDTNNNKLARKIAQTIIRIFNPNTEVDFFGL